ncbi:hypothetical protein HI914_07365 [Erysiphe necator]|nr:hypothetical protein HI914_07365 [Erysiphe necator]
MPTKVKRETKFFQTAASPEGITPLAHTKAPQVKVADLLPSPDVSSPPVVSMVAFYIAVNKD